MGGGLTRRMAVAIGLLALIVGTAFTVLLVSVADLRTAARPARHSEEVLAAAKKFGHPRAGRLDERTREGDAYPR